VVLLQDVRTALRSSSNALSRPLVRTPIRLLTMKMPPRVTTNMANRKGHDPSSPPIVPASRVRISSSGDLAKAQGLPIGVRRNANQCHDRRDDDDQND